MRVHGEHSVQPLDEVVVQVEDLDGGWELAGEAVSLRVVAKGVGGEFTRRATAASTLKVVSVEPKTCCRLIHQIGLFSNNDPLKSR